LAACDSTPNEGLSGDTVVLDTWQLAARTQPNGCVGRSTCHSWSGLSACVGQRKHHAEEYQAQGAADDAQYIDWILISGQRSQISRAVEVEEVGVVTESMAEGALLAHWRSGEVDRFRSGVRTSDHFPVYADLRIRS
jgi:hypothetical protein